MGWEGGKELRGQHRERRSVMAKLSDRPLIVMNVNLGHIIAMNVHSKKRN